MAIKAARVMAAGKAGLESLPHFVNELDRRGIKQLAPFAIDHSQQEIDRLTAAIAQWRNGSAAPSPFDGWAGITIQTDIPAINRLVRRINPKAEASSKLADSPSHLAVWCRTQIWQYCRETVQLWDRFTHDQGIDRADQLAVIIPYCPEGPTSGTIGMYLGAALRWHFEDIGRASELVVWGIELCPPFSELDIVSVQNVLRGYLARREIIHGLPLSDQADDVSRNRPFDVNLVFDGSGTRLTTSGTEDACHAMDLAAAQAVACLLGGALGGDEPESTTRLKESLRWHAYLAHVVSERSYDSDFRYARYRNELPWRKDTDGWNAMPPLQRNYHFQHSVDAIRQSVANESNADVKEKVQNLVTIADELRSLVQEDTLEQTTADLLALLEQLDSDPLDETTLQDLAELLSTPGVRSSNENAESIRGQLLYARQDWNRVDELPDLQRQLSANPNPQPADGALVNWCRELAGASRNDDLIAGAQLLLETLQRTPWQRALVERHALDRNLFNAGDPNPISNADIITRLNAVKSELENAPDAARSTGHGPRIIDTLTAQIANLNEVDWIASQINIAIQTYSANDDARQCSRTVLNATGQVNSAALDLLRADLNAGIATFGLQWRPARRRQNQIFKANLVSTLRDKLSDFSNEVRNNANTATRDIGNSFLDWAAADRQHEVDTAIAALTEVANKSLHQAVTDAQELREWADSISGQLTDDVILNKLRQAARDDDAYYRDFRSSVSVPEVIIPRADPFCVNVRLPQDLRDKVMNSSLDPMQMPLSEVLGRGGSEAVRSKIEELAQPALMRRDGDFVAENCQALFESIITVSIVGDKDNKDKDSLRPSNEFIRDFVDPDCLDFAPAISALPFVLPPPRPNLTSDGLLNGPLPSKAPMPRWNTAA